ncbi:Domain of unknown function DUF292, eukaryotic [Ostreococcus tauri]|uniref:Regulator of Vps4 activity in the MVB pathway-domain-containing protein n=1 Tax=Ostreococcus tauri TaxID=70448 RepID=A0A096P7V3_OSTTA|nr:Domain of unknown function DUF292, eukaryotic [Ostreococcus tauri]CEF97055.1 Domain of unknown function DUF292, eukaryotic [Ostreococcus tauri]|eukprot:XP_022838460.1 Domain of unknown function DUF292, eukaryotic [Ostreococcus tauri]
MSALFDALKSTLGIGYDEKKTKTLLRLCAGRLKLIKNKRTSARMTLEREVVDVLERNNGRASRDTASVRAESVCREERALRAYEILELALETLLARLHVVATSSAVPDELREPIATIIFASKKAKAELPELDGLKKQLGRRYGREYVAACEGDSTARACGAHVVVMECLKVRTVDSETVERKLEEIARDHGVELEPAMPTAIPVSSVPAVAMETKESVEAMTSSYEYGTAQEAAHAAEAAAKRAQHASEAAAALAGLEATSSSTRDMKDASDADIDAVIGEVLAMSDELPDPSASAPPPGVGGAPNAHTKFDNPKSYPKPKSSSPLDDQDDTDDLAQRLAALKKS